MGGRGTPQGPIFLICMEPTLESATISIKFTGYVDRQEESWTKNRTGGRGTPHRPIFLTCIEPTLDYMTVMPNS